MGKHLSRAATALRRTVRAEGSLLVAMKAANRTVSQIHHGLAKKIPALIRPMPRQLTIAVTAFCNLRCVGCNYGRDFMSGKQLSWNALETALTDARWCGIEKVRLYGGEPLLHPKIVRAVRHAKAIGLDPYITTNGLLLGQKIDALFDAGLRLVTIGFYGEGQDYNSYTQRPGRYRLLEQSVAYAREHSGADLEMQLNYVLLKPSCSIEAVDAAWRFAQRFNMHLHVDLGSETLPFFNTGDDGSLTLHESDRPALVEVASHLLQIKRKYPKLVLHSEAFLASIPDWMLLGRKMRVACNAYQHVWIGADGSVQLCDVTFPLGNINVTPLRDILYSSEHKAAACNAFALNCPNCKCQVESWIQTNFQTYRRYSAKAKSIMPLDQ